MVTQKVPETPLPAPGQSDEAAHAAISRRFREHSVIEIQKGNRLQASEKIWAAVAQQLKAVAEDRGWANESHGHLRDIAWQLYRETRDDRIRLLFRSVESMHTNFYENEETWDDVEGAWVDAEELVERLETLRGQPPAAYTPRSESDQIRLARLLGYDLRNLAPGQRRATLGRFPLGQPSEVGFAPNYGYRPPDGSGNGGNGGAPAPCDPAGGPPVPIVPSAGEVTQVSSRQEPAGSVATETRQEGRRQNRPSRSAGQAKASPAKAPRKPKGIHAFLRKGETKGR